MSVKIADVLERAADYIDQHGWCQDEYADDSGRVCAAGAISAITEGSPERFAPLSMRLALSNAVEDLGFTGIADWNDALGRTQAEVTAKIREVAAAERAKAATP